MRALNINIFLFILFLITAKSVAGQYTLNGNASQNNCHCYTLTNDAYDNSGSVWNNNKIDLNQSFDFKFDVFLGCSDNLGADGIAFVLQPVSTSIGSQGSGLGYSGISPSVGVTIDTYENGIYTLSGSDSDPAFDHIAIQLNGDINHRDSAAPWPVNNIAGPVPALAGSDNIEDCKWHILQIKWDAPTKTLSAHMDGVIRVSAVKDLVTNVFGNDPLVFWGFTGSTGGEKNLQQVCTSLKPSFRSLVGQKLCAGESISFYDSTTSFAAIKKLYWDFGDGSPVDSINVNPVHKFVSAGNYSIVQTVVGADGCVETNTQQVTVGSLPIADFTFNNACASDSLVYFTNISSAKFGSINQWYWDLGNGDTSTSQHVSKLYTKPGFIKVRLMVKSMEGCISDTTDHMVQIYEKPVVDFNVSDACKNTSVSLAGINSTDIGVFQWQWNFHDGSVSHSKDTQHVFLSGGNFPIQLWGSSQNGCNSDTVQKNIVIYTTDVYAGNDTLAAPNQPVQLNASGGINYEWMPATGLNNAFIASPVATNNVDRSYIVRAFTPMGCESFDTIRIKIYKGPDIYVPGAFSPNGDGLNELLKAIPVGVSHFKRFTVYNRFGKIVFTTNVSTNGWNGLYNGKPQNTGAYLWIAEATGYTGNIIFKKGTVMLVR